jgi:hypothetical protein
MYTYTDNLFSTKFPKIHIEEKTASSINDAGKNRIFIARE